LLIPGRSGRDLSAWIGLVPKQNSSGGKDKLGSISKQGDRYLRSLFTTGALAVVRYAKLHGTKQRPTKVAAIGLRSGNPPTYKAIRMARALYVEYATGEKEYHGLATDPDELYNTFASLPATEVNSAMDLVPFCRPPSLACPG
jgi:Transposase IS116/IS110/IS902 family